MSPDVRKKFWNDIKERQSKSITDFNKKQAQEEFARIKKQTQETIDANDDLQEKLIKTNENRYDRDVELLYRYLEERKKAGENEISFTGKSFSGTATTPHFGQCMTGIGSPQ